MNLSFLVKRLIYLSVLGESKNLSNSGSSYHLHICLEHVPNFSGMIKEMDTVTQVYIRTSGSS